MSEDRPSEEKPYRRLETQTLLQQIAFRGGLEALEASENGNLAWVTSGFPVEIPIAMNVGNFSGSSMPARFICMYILNGDSHCLGRGVILVNMIGILLFLVA